MSQAYLSYRCILQEELVLVLGRQDFDVFAGKIWQLKFCEEAAFGIIWDNPRHILHYEWETVD